ncbi:MAG TPA: 2'-5' RNA ligase family protein [Nocardioidaceae bacterium]|nr:2'-5' RNA ligase family protein [Nocardioidaceae bacterium]
MALAVCLLPDAEGDRVLRGLWRRLEEAGLPTLLTHTHGRHVPHLTLASLQADDADAVVATLADVPAMAPFTMRFDALGVFPRSRCWLVPSASTELIATQQEVVRVLTAVDARIHRGYLAGAWLPHLTLAPRLHLDDLPVVARHCFDILPLTIRLTHAGLVDTSTGDVRPLPGLIE